ncbi:MAG: selenocysteine-specific translation elongation factor [Clostridiales bacterium]|jgi:selenocysteine-specific elongation factor|nr:selenocysteine-specific translation elongation factor [Clostridiales bacterium]
MRNVIIGTAGHVDHGKTSLIKALTGKDTDRLKEEKKRGITIDLGFTNMPNPKGINIGIIDVPGHERFIRNMLAGIGGIDLVLLVIAADEGIMPQTLEHFEILKMLGINKGIIAITKVDLVEAEWIEMVEEDIKETVRGTFMENAPIIRVSSYTGQNIDELKNIIFYMLEEVESRRTDPSLLRIPVDRVFIIDGFGTVITGTLMEGSISVGSEVQIFPGDRIARVRSLQVHGNMVDTAYAGQRTAVNLMNVKKTEIKRGDLLAAKGSLTPTMMLDVKIRMFDDAPRTLVNGMRLHLYCGSAEVLCKAILLNKEKLDRGEEGYAQLRLEEELAVKKDDRFILRFYSPVESIGGGIILDSNPIKHKRFKQDIIEALSVKEVGDGKSVLEQIIKEGNISDVRNIANRLGKTVGEISSDVERLVKEERTIKLTDDLIAHKEYFDFAKDATKEILEDYHRKNPISSGIQKGELSKRLADKLRIQDIKMSDLLIKLFNEIGLIDDKGKLVALSTFKVIYNKEQLALQESLEKLYNGYGYEIAELEEAISDYKDKNLAKQMVEALESEGKLHRLSYKYYMHKSHWDRAISLLYDFINANEKITLAEYRDLLGTSRKYAVMILEYLDEQKVTKLIGDSRILL